MLVAEVVDDVGGNGIGIVAAERVEIRDEIAGVLTRPVGRPVEERRVPGHD